jgi:hypothetical protein
MIASAGPAALASRGQAPLRTNVSRAGATPIVHSGLLGPSERRLACEATAP